MLPDVPFDPVAVSGRIAFAHEQSAQFRKMRCHCIDMWQHIDEFVRLKGEGIKIMPDRRFNGSSLHLDEEQSDDEDNLW